MKRALYVAAGPGEWRAVLAEDGLPVELVVERGEGAEIGSLYLGRVERLLPALGASLVDIGGERPAFLPDREILPRGRRLAEGERVVVQIRRETQGGKAAGLTMQIEPRRMADTAGYAATRDPPARLHPDATFAAAIAGAARAVDQIFLNDIAAIPETRAAFPQAAVAHAAAEDWPIDLDALFDSALSPVVRLGGGGSVRINPGAAATLIDVDSGTPPTGSPERAALATNIEAAAVIAREIRQRSLGGGIVVDFVGLDRRELRERVRAALAKALTSDPARPRILGWTRLGHLELVRPRRRRPLAETLLDPENATASKSALSVAYEVLRALQRAARKSPGRQWRLIVGTDIAVALVDGCADALLVLKERFGRRIVIEADPARRREEFEIVPL
jgi:ribonuclease G